MNQAVLILTFGILREEYNEMKEFFGGPEYTEVLRAAGVSDEFLRYWEEEYDLCRDTSPALTYKWVVYNYCKSNSSTPVHQLARDTLVPEGILSRWLAEVHWSGDCTCAGCRH